MSTKIEIATLDITELRNVAINLLEENARLKQELIEAKERKREYKAQMQSYQSDLYSSHS